jgi:O-antigen/teichoic acid export membrane protein
MGRIVDKCTEVEQSVVKWSEGLRNRVSIIIRRHIDHMKFYCFFHILLVLFCITVCMVVYFVCFYFILYFMNSYYYIRSFLGIVFHCVVLCTVGV